MTVNQATKSPGSLPKWAIVIGVLLLLAGLPLAAWLDLRNIAEQSLKLQASDLNSVITSVRGYYGKNVVARVLARMAMPTSTRVRRRREALKNGAKCAWHARCSLRGCALCTGR